MMIREWTLTEVRVGGIDQATSDSPPKLVQYF